MGTNLHLRSSNRLGTCHHLSSRTRKHLRKSPALDPWDRSGPRYSHHQGQPSRQYRTFLEGTRHTHPLNRVRSLNCRCQLGKGFLRWRLSWSVLDSRIRLGTQQGARLGCPCCKWHQDRCCQLGTRCNCLDQCLAGNSHPHSLEDPARAHCSSFRRSRSHQPK